MFLFKQDVKRIKNECKWPKLPANSKSTQNSEGVFLFHESSELRFGSVA